MQYSNIKRIMEGLLNKSYNKSYNKSTSTGNKITKRRKKAWSKKIIDELSDIFDEIDINCNKCN